MQDLLYKYAADVENLFYFWPDWNSYARLDVFHTSFSTKEVTFLVCLPKNVKSQMINYQILNICRSLLAVVAEHGFLSPQFLTVSLMRVPIRSFGETNSALLRTRNGIYIQGLRTGGGQRPPPVLR